MAVTARHPADGVDYFKRYAYFPKLGFGLMARWTDNVLFEAEVTRGITALSPRSWAPAGSTPSAPTRAPTGVINRSGFAAKTLCLVVGLRLLLG